jgi:hypothetical protein
MSKNKRAVFSVTKVGDYWIVNLELPYQRAWELLDYYTRRRDAKRAALRTARKLRLDPMQFEIKYS